MGTTSSEELTVLERQNLRESMAKLKADASEIITYTRQLKGLHKHFDSVEANIMKRSRELDLKEKELQILSSDLDKKIKTFEAEKSKAGDLTKLVEECNELRSKRNQLTASLDSSPKVQRELELRIKQLGQVKSELGRLCNEAREVDEHNRGMEEERARNTKDLALILGKIEESGKQLEAVDEQLESRQKLLEIQSLELVSTEKKLEQVKSELGRLCNEAREVDEHNRGMEEERARNTKDLALILGKIEESGKQLEAVDEQLESRQKLLEIQSLELVSTEKKLEQVKSELGRLCNEAREVDEHNRGMEEERARNTKDLALILGKIEESGKQLEAVDEQLESRQKLLEIQSLELVSTEKKLEQVKSELGRLCNEAREVDEHNRGMEEERARYTKDLALILGKIEESGKQLEAVDEQLESRQKLLEIQSLELVSTEKKLEQVKSELGRLCNEAREVDEHNRGMEEERARNTKDLALILGKIEESGKQLAAVDEQLESRQKLLEIQSLELVSTEKKLEQVKSELGRLCNEAREVDEHNRGMEEERARNTKDLALILGKIEESGKQLEAVDEQLESRQKLLEIQSLELVSTEKKLEQVKSELGRLCNEAREVDEHNRGMEEERARNTKDLALILGKIEESGKQLEAVDEQLESRQKLLEIQSLELVSTEKKLEQVKSELGRLCNEAREVDEHNRGMEEERARNTKDLALILGKIEESGKQLAAVDEQLESRQNLLETRSLELVSTEKKLGCVRESIERSNSDLKLKEKMVQSLKIVITDCGKTIDSKSEELGEIQKLIEQQTSELGVLRNHHDAINQLIQVLSGELVAKEKTHKEILETICRSSSEMKERAKEIKAAEIEASDLNVRSERFRQDVEGKEKELDLLKNHIESEGRKLIELKREMEEETYRKKKELELVLSKVEESGKQLAAVDKQLESQGKLLEIRSVELVSKEMELGCVRESIKLSISDLELKKKMVQSLNNRITVCGKTIDSKSEELGEIQKLIEQQNSELGVMHNQRDSIRMLIQELSEELVAKEKRHEEILETICRNSSEMEEKTARKTKNLALILDKIEKSDKQLATVDEKLESRRRLLEIQSLELVSKEKELGCVRKSIKLSISDLELKKKMVESENNRITVCRKMIDSKSKELGEIQKLIKQQTSELGVIHTQRDSIRMLIEGLSKELVAKEMELECVVESSKHFKFDIEVKEKRVQALNNLIKISAVQLDTISKELGEIQRELELKKRLRQMSTDLVKHEKQPAAAPVNDSSQQNAAETEPVNEEALTHNRFAASLTRHEVATVLRALPNPAEFVLEEVQELICEELDLQDSLLEILVLFFEELTEIQRSDDPQLQDKATQVATLWKGKITIVAPKSSLEALAFLLFIVAYELKELINEEETGLLASSIAHYEQAPKLFDSLCLNREIRKFVKELIEKSQYIPAVRLVCLFKLNDEFSPSHFLEKEIINLRQSALEKRPTESSQAKDKDAGRLRAILELVADYKLKINLPGDLIAKLMIQRENSAPLVRCSVKHQTSSSNPQANSPNPASAQSSSVNLRVPKPEFKPYLK